MSNMLTFTSEESIEKVRQQDQEQINWITKEIKIYWISYTSEYWIDENMKTELKDMVANNEIQDAHSFSVWNSSVGYMCIRVNLCHNGYISRSSAQEAHMPTQDDQILVEIFTG